MFPGLKHIRQMDPSFDPVAFAGSRRRISPTRTDVATISKFMTLPPFLGARPRPCDISLDLMDDIIIVNYITQARGGRCVARSQRVHGIRGVGDLGGAPGMGSTIDGTSFGSPAAWGTLQRELYRNDGGEG